MRTSSLDLVTGLAHADWNRAECSPSVSDERGRIHIAATGQSTRSMSDPTANGRPSRLPFLSHDTALEVRPPVRPLPDPIQRSAAVCPTTSRPPSTRARRAWTPHSLRGSMRGRRRYDINVYAGELAVRPPCAPTTESDSEGRPSNAASPLSSEHAVDCAASDVI